MFTTTHAIEKIEKGESKLIFIKDDKICFESSSMGIKGALLAHKSHLNGLKNASVIDKVVGKGAAFIFVKLKVKSVHAFLLSIPAKNLLKEHNISVSYNKLVPIILNRTGVATCPIEELVKDINDLEEAIAKMENFIK